MTKSAVFSGVLALGGLLAVVSPALAEVVDFTTTGIFSTSGTNAITGTTFGGKTASVTFDPVTMTSPQFPQQDVPPAVDTLGNFAVVLPPGTSVTGSGTFLLTVNQAIEGGPSGSSDYGASTVSGTLSRVPGAPTGSVIITFAQTSVVIDGVTYTLEDLGQNGLGPNQLAIGANGASIEAALTTSPTPEPTFFGLTAAGFFGLAFIAIRRHKQNSAKTIQ